MPDHPAPASYSWQWFAVGSALFAALTTLLGKLGVAEINSNFATFLRTIVIAAMTAGILSWRGDWEPLAKLSSRGAWLIVLSAIATGLSWLCYYRALQLAPASRVAPIDKLSVVLVIVLAALFLNERITPQIALGAALIVAGVLLVGST